MSYVRAVGELNWAAASQAIAAQTVASGPDPYAAAQAVHAQMLADEAARGAAQVAADEASARRVADQMVANAVIVRNAELAEEARQRALAEEIRMRAALAEDDARRRANTPVEDNSGSTAAGPGAGQPTFEQPEDHSGGINASPNMTVSASGPPWLMLGAAALGLYLVTRKS